MINKCHDIELIDWDSGTFDDYISEENTYFDDKISTEDIIKKTIQQDKFDLLLMYFSYLHYGDFKHEMALLTRSLNLKSLELSKAHQQALINFINEEKVPQDYYYIDFIDDLINTNYQAPIIYKRNSLHK